MSNLDAFLDMIAFSEGTSTSRLTKNNGYDVIVTGLDGPEIFTDYSDHPFAHRPPKVINKKGLESTASGRYQFMVKDWAHYKHLLGLPDFGPLAQRRWAIQLLKETGALLHIDHGEVKKAVQRCRNIWASLPGAGYGQPERHIDSLLAAYSTAGGRLA